MKTAIISGGTRGIGRGVAIQLLKDGFNVVAFSPNQESIDKFNEELEKEYSQGKFLVLKGDVTDEASVKSVVDETMKKFGSVDVLVNNASFGYFGDVDGADVEQFEKMMKVNVTGVIILTKHVSKIMKENKSGLIINLSSISGKKAFAYGEFYAASKLGIMGYSAGIREELKPFGIKVSTICPGMIKTDFFGKEEMKRRMEQWGGKKPQMLEVDDVSRVISLIANQSEHCDIQDLTLMPFD